MIAFFGFDQFTTGAGSYTGGSNYFAALVKPAGFYTAKGYDTLDQSVEMAAQVISGGGVEGGALGCFSANSGAYITSTNRTNARTAKGGQMAIVRSAFGIAEEIYFTADIRVMLASDTTHGSTYMPAEDYLQMFKWGDVSVRMKSATWTGVLFNMVAAVYNGATEVATVAFSVPNTTWSFMKVHVKLDASAGLIDVTINGNAQSVSYTGQNTVATTSLASAPVIYFGVPAWDNGTNLMFGSIDNCYFDLTAFPSGRPTARLLALSGETATGWTATGTSVTTIRNALTSDSLAGNVLNAKAARGSGAGSDCLFDFTALTTSDLDTNVLGFLIAASGVHNRSFTTSRKLSVGVSLSGTHNMGTVIAGTSLPLDTVATPPSTTANKFIEMITEKPAAAGPYTKTDLNSVKIRILVG